MIPTPGQIVQYTLSSEDVDRINYSRKQARAYKDISQTGAIYHSGNTVSTGETYPLVITRAWGDKEDSAVNGQVLLDGNDTFWVTSVSQGDGERHFREYPRV